MGDNIINEKLWFAAYGGSYDEIAGCISRGADPGWTDRDGYSALHWAVFRCRGFCGTKDGTRRRGMTGAGDHYTLHITEEGQVEVIQLLAARGAEINCQDSYQETPLHPAARYDQTAAV